MADYEDGKGDENEASGKIFSRILDENIRTADVISDVKFFGDLMISPKICELLNKCQYYTPTPVQAKAIPLLLFGSDMLVQAKAGTGKTLVFAILAAKVLHESEKTRTPQVLIVAPTREIAKQIYDTVRLFTPSNFWSGLFVGGTDISSDVKLLKEGCQLAVGTCGRIAQLIKLKVLQLTEVQLFVLDEADKLMEEDFVKQVNYIFSMMQHEMKQTCVFSATYPTQLEQALKNYMRSPTLLRLNIEGEQLVGVKEYCVFCDTLKKAEALMILLNKLIFNQCIIFCDTLDFCGDVYGFLVKEGVECASLGSNLPQAERFQILKKLKNKQIRVLVATDLMARGVDIFGVDLVVNLAPSYDMETHMHRVGRAGRYGGRGVAITMLGNTKEAVKLSKLMRNKALDIRTLDVCKDFPYNLIESGDDFHANSVPFEKHPIITGNNSNDLSNALSYMTIESKQDDTVSEISIHSSTTQAQVPARARTRNVYYTRRDFFQIYLSHTTKEWIQYSCENMVISDYVCITGVLYAHPELAKFQNDFSKQQTTKPVEPAKNPTPPLAQEAEPVKQFAQPSSIQNVKLVEQSTQPSPEQPTSICASSERVLIQRPESNVTEDEEQYLKPFRPFRSIGQFRKIYDELNEQLEKKTSEDATQLFAVIPNRPTPEQCRKDAEQIIELRKYALEKPDD